MFSLWIIRLAVFVHVVHYTPTECLVQNVSEVCTSTSCLVLYSDEAGWTREQSKLYCNSQNMELTSIPDVTTQLGIKQMLSNVNLAADVRVWVGGRRSTDGTWRYLNGSVFYLGVSFGEPGGCIWFRENNPPSEKYISDQCDELISHARTVCQFFPGHNGTCHNIPGCSSSFIHRTVCYAVCNNLDVTWYTAQTYCRTQVNGDLVATDVNDTALTDRIFQDVVRPIKKIWTGITRYPWIWNGGSVSTIMKYYNWSSQPWYNTRGQCVLLDPKGGWTSGHCSTPLKYFICTKGIDVPIAPPTTQQQSSTVTFDFAVSQTATPMHVLGVSFEVVVVAIVVIVVVVVVVVPVVVLVVLKKRRKAQTPHVYENNDTQPPGHLETEDLSVVYDSVGDPGLETGYTSWETPRGAQTPDHTAPYEALRKT